jgi:sulfur carrier protein ThiS
MQVAVHAPGYLSREAAADAQSVRVDLVPQTTAKALLATLGIPRGEVWRVAVNGTLVPDTCPLHENDSVMLFAPIGGG